MRQKRCLSGFRLCGVCRALKLFTEHYYMKKVFIDGSSGTTGLRIRERLQARDDIELITLPETEKKSIGAKREALNSADVAVLCLPDEAARESVSLVENPDTVIIDASTAHRTKPGWVYGFPELSEEQAEKISAAKRIAVPGCHASGFIALVYPLVKAGIIDASERLFCFSLTGYSGGGKKMIADYEATDRDFELCAPRQYAMGQQHKHLAEMKAVTGLDSFPVFCPVVSDFYSGMQVTVPLFAESLCKGHTSADIADVYRSLYKDSVVSFCETAGHDGFLSAAELCGKDSMYVSVGGNGERILLLAVYDNLGKGASGTALECLNLALGCSKEYGLKL